MNQRFYVLLSASALGAALAIGACGGNALLSDTPPTATTGPGSSSGGGMGGGGAPDCFTNPKTHVEIINACTTAERIDKNPNLPLLGPRGELPPLP